MRVEYELMNFGAEEAVFLPPDPSRVMEGLRDTGYDFDTAIADIVDNSIAAGATKINILLQIDPQQNVTVYIADNGEGMDYDGLKNAMTYGSKRRIDPSSLGKFGLGLKTASTAFCKCLSVISRDSKSSPIIKVQWDLDYISNKNEWKLLVAKPCEDEIDLLEQTANKSSGTLVVWEKTDRLLRLYSHNKHAKNALKRIEDNLRFHLSLTYQEFLDPDKLDVQTVEIILNGERVNAWDPFCEHIKETELLANEIFEVELPNGEIQELSLRAFMLPGKNDFSSVEDRNYAKISNDLQGFYVYREHRLIHYGDWMGMFTREPHGSLLRVKLSFNHTLDEAFNVDIKKSRILLDDALYNGIKDYIGPARRAADERYRKGTKETIVAEGHDAHDASNRNIEDKAKGVEGSKVTITDESKNEVEIANSKGVFKHTISIRTSTKPGQYRVIPVENLDDGMLWSPCIVDGKHAVEINQGHPYYQKIYYPILAQNVMVTGMDALLWALAEAELSTFNADTKEQYEEMRVQVSRCLKKLLTDLPEPKENIEE